MSERYIDAAESIVGRVAVIAAKAALLGDKVHVVNCEKAVVSGRREAVLADADYHRSRPGRPSKGPFIIRTTDRYVRRMISRMLPRENDFPSMVNGSFADRALQPCCRRSARASTTRSSA